ncbi:MAG: aminotransferase class I/II-fold pyridoxal phosphate-dependent enzyme, partial [Clostridium sp.]
MTSERIFLASPHMGDYEQDYIKEAFETNWIAPLGPNVNGFEEELAEVVGIKSAAALISGTSAIHLAIKLIGINPGDIVFCSSLTFSASCNPIIYEGAIPVFIDSEPESWNMSPRALREAFEFYAKKGQIAKGIVVVNLYGQSADMDEIREICNTYGAKIIEDAAESLGATYKGKMSGTLGDFGIYSFNGNKIITTSGGGMLISNDEESIKKAKFWATQSKEEELYYQHEELGYNYKMSNLVAGVGRGQLKVLNQRIKKKRLIYKIYKEAFKDIEEIEMMPMSDNGKSNCWLTAFTIKEGYRIKPIDVVMEMEKNNIEARHVWKPMQIQPYFKEYKFFNHN